MLENPDQILCLRNKRLSYKNAVNQVFVLSRSLCGQMDRQAAY
jgi:hypothetical protein